MLMRGKPFVPPNCTVLQDGRIEDLSAVEFFIGGIKGGDSDVVTDAQLTIFFGDKNAGDDEDEYVGAISSSVIVPLGSMAAINGMRLADMEATDPPVEAVRQTFCERVANCRGVIEGECWAIGAPAIREVLARAELPPETPAA